MNNPEDLELMKKFSNLTDEEKKKMMTFSSTPSLKVVDALQGKCSYCGGSGYDPYPNHDTTMRPCPECSGV